MIWVCERRQFLRERFTQRISSQSLLPLAKGLSIGRVGKLLQAKKQTGQEDAGEWARDTDTIVFYRDD